MQRGEPTTPREEPAAEPSTQPPPGGADVDLSERNVPCLHCGYNLRGMSLDGACPECGNPVRRSLQGNLLIFSAPEYVARLHRGLVVILIAALLALAVGIGLTTTMLIMSGGGGTMTLALITSLVNIPIAAASLMGWWLFSDPDPSVRVGDSGDRPRLIIRATVVVMACAAVGDLAVQALTTEGASWGPAQYAAGIPAWIAGVVQFFASMLYIRWLAPRIPDALIRDRAHRYLWILPLTYVLGACVIVGPFIAVTLYLLLLNQVRRHLVRIRESQAETMAAAGA